ncbi:hypothetical protein LH991_01200 [Schleiferilactobacillus harbinensis]|uniref:Uncharacterized protein n=1 Tax=Schleiferilactobacillus harbinensis DSM 16991 TaxID=1122147 RepID=A0A0R1XI63_9LACO|nr:hypothetical protein [Schleiferilactobacillus harbinensis]KRM27545.1 hypothetical protein FC91_GL002461 [Schleiferilactobacillus harbinensis DSM 16991]QFR62703.1 hypothetical protein LH991_01200 [Schleiferilactobacillus harbinensis]
MRDESKLLLKRYDHYFLREYNYRYWLVIVKNRFDNVYGFFIESQKKGEAIVHSNELLSLPFASGLYAEVLADLKAHSHLRIVPRDTAHLEKLVPAVTFDPLHGHRHSTAYLPTDKNNKRS